MYSAAALRSSGPVGSVSLVETIATLNDEFANMREDLRDAHTEIDRLSEELYIWEDLRGELPEIDLASLRRQAAFRCHPDRGGDAHLMSSLNVLFDFFEGSKKVQCAFKNG